MSSKSIANLTGKLRDLQIESGLTDKQMAQQLDCIRQLWQMTRTGKTPLGIKILKGIAKNLPGLHQDIIYFLAQDGDKLSWNGDRIPLKQHSEAQGRALKKFCMGLLERIKERLQGGGK